MPSLLPIKFKYTNWRGEEYEYVMTPEPSLSFGTAPQWGDERHPGEEAHADVSSERTWLISGHVHTRAGEERPGRRTFELTGMRDIELVTE